MSIESGARWLLLIHQLPAKPAYARVKIWRRLQALGAVAVKNAVYALPANDDGREDFAWLVRQIEEMGGEAIVLEAALVEGLNDAALRESFDAAREADYRRIASEARALMARLSADAADGELAEVATQAGRLRKQLATAAAIDFFGAEGRAAAQGLVSGLEAELQGEGEVTASSAVPPVGELSKRVWVTRQQVQVDRIASAWLIRRFIDRDARFKFVQSSGYQPAPGELRFDMFEGEFTHRGDRCTFEVLLAHAGIDDPALAAIGEIIHDIDLKDDKYGRAETAGVKSLIAGIATAGAGDEQRLARGAVLFDGLYDSFTIEQKS
jgi:hypothetical protein